MPAWMDIVGRAIPTTLRGRFFGVANVLGSAGGLVGASAPPTFSPGTGAGELWHLLSLRRALHGPVVRRLALVRSRPRRGRPAQPMRAFLRGLPPCSRATAT